MRKNGTRSIARTAALLFCLVQLSFMKTLPSTTADTQMDDKKEVGNGLVFISPKPLKDGGVPCALISCYQIQSASILVSEPSSDTRGIIGMSIGMKLLFSYLM